RELAETPVGQCGGLARRLANDEVDGADRLRPEFAGLDGALLDPRVPCTGGFVERVNAGVPFIGWARCPFPMSRVRRDSGHTTPGHIGAPFSVALGRRGGTAPTSGDVEGWPGRPQRRCSQTRSRNSRCQL